MVNTMNARKFYIIAMLLVVLSLVISACGAQSPTPAQPTAISPTAEPTQAPTQEQPSEEDAMSTDSGLAMLTEGAWMWTEYTDPSQQFNVDQPENYTLHFLEDGTVQIKADCNNGSGKYTADGSNIQIEVGAMTLAACPPESRSDDFIQYLGSAAIYFFKDENLNIDLMADGGTLTFTPADGQGSTSSSNPDLAMLTEGTWMWTEFTNPAQQFNLDHPENYTLRFLEDGTFQFEAD